MRQRPFRGMEMIPYSREGVYRILSAFDYIVIQYPQGAKMYFRIIPVAKAERMMAFHHPKLTSLSQKLDNIPLHTISFKWNRSPCLSPEELPSG